MSIKDIFQPKSLAHVCMLAFAGASLFNLQSYLDARHHNTYLAWSLAGALAFVLVILAALLSGIPWNLRDSKFLTVLTVTTGLTVVSGAIQGSAYANDGNVWAGYALGFALPGLGELGLALAISAYNRSLDGREVSAAQRELATGVRRHLVDAIAHVDKSLIEAQVNRAVGKVTKELVDSVVVDMISELRGNRTTVQNQDASTDALEAQKPMVQIAQNEVISSILSDNTVKIERMNAGKQRKIEHRRSSILNIIGNSELSIPELALQLDVSANTIRTDLEALQSNGHNMSINGVVKLVP